MTALVPVSGSTPTDEELRDAQRTLRCIAEFNATIDIWTARANHATDMAEYHRGAKERFIESITRGAPPFWLPTCPR